MCTMTEGYSCWLGTILLLVQLQLIICCCEVNNCTGWKAICSNNSNTCVCPQNYSLHNNNRDCQQDNCAITDCLECDGAYLCTKCVYILEVGHKKCLSKCTGETQFNDTNPLQSAICYPAAVQANRLSMDVVIGVFAGISGALLICIVVLVIYCVYSRRRRWKVNLNETVCTVGDMQTGNVKKLNMHDNKGFDQVSEPSLVHNVIDRDVYVQEIERLKPHAQTLLSMLNEIRHKLHAMNTTDPRVSTYKGMIHQMCRVLVLIHKKDPGASIPADALGLMEWAQKMIEDRQFDVEPAEESIKNTPVNRISYIDVPPSSQHNSNPYAIPCIKKSNPYATLNKRNSQMYLLNMSNFTDTNYYSCIQVPVNISDTEPIVNTVSISQNNTLNSTMKENLKKQYEIPLDLKKMGDSFSTVICSGSDVTMGYFSNGRFYDPTSHEPTKKHVPEIYAPVSSYSDPSNPLIFSTFTGGVSRIPSQDSGGSNPSDQDQDDGEDQLNDIDGDGFPFDLNDATEPVEV